MDLRVKRQEEVIYGECSDLAFGTNLIMGKCMHVLIHFACVIWNVLSMGVYGWMIQSMGGNARLLNEPLKTIVKSHTVCTPEVHTWTTSGPWTATRPRAEDTQMVCLYSLSRSKTLAQLLHQRFSLPLFGDVREQLSGSRSTRTYTIRNQSHGIHQQLLIN